MRARLICLAISLALALTACRRHGEQTTPPSHDDRWRHIEAGAGQKFPIALRAGQFVRVVFEQKDIDLILSAELPDGEKLPKLSVGEYGYEAIDLLTKRAGTAWVTVTADDDDSAGGDFRVRIAESREERPQDQLRLKAHRLFAAAFAGPDSSKETNASQIAACREALAWWRESGDSLREAQALRVMGRLLQRDAKYIDAQAAYVESLRLLKQAGDRRGALDVTKSWENLGGYFGERRAPLDVLQAHLKEWRALGERRGEGRSLESLAFANAQAGDYPTAIRLDEQALAIWRALGNESGVTDTLEGVAGLYAQSGNARKAVKYSEEALELNRKRHDMRGVASSLYTLGYNLIHAGRYDEGIHALNESIALREQQGDLSAEIGTRQILAMAAQTHGDWPRAVAECGRATDIEARISQVFADPVMNARYLQGDAAYEICVATMGAAGEHRTAEGYEESAFLQADSYRTRYMAPGAPLPAPAELSRNVDAGSVLAEYWIDPKNRAGFVWLLTQAGFSFKPLAECDKIPGLAVEVFRQISERPQPGKTSAMPAAAEMSRLLLAPIAREIAGKRLLIVSDESFGFVPLGILPDPSRTDGAALIASHEIVYLPSALALVRIRERRDAAPRGKLLAIVSDPVFSREDSRFPGVGKSPFHLALTPKLRAVTRSFAWSRSGSESIPRLPFASTEAGAVASEAPIGAVDVYSGFDANRQAALTKLRGHRIVHVITHGLANADSPELSGLILSLYDERGQQRPGFVDLASVYGLSLPADLVTLSACQTASGERIRTQGVIGLTAAFFHAGARRVVSSSWQVDDESTTELMTRFYANLFHRHLRPGEALRRAQLSVASIPGWGSPYYWAGFRLYGEGRSLWQRK